MESVTDRFSITLGALFLLGAASLLPWNFFITANEYWMYRFRNTSEPFEPKQKHNDIQLLFSAYLSITSNVVFIVFLGLNTFLSKRISSNTRIVYPLLIAIILFAITTCFAAVDTDEWQITFLVITLLTVALLNVLVGFFMGASMGVCGYLPPQYMASCSLGQAVGGLICVATQIFCILLNLGYQGTAFVYFSAATIMLFLTLIAYRFMRKSDFFKHYSTLADSSLSLSFNNQTIPYWTIFLKGWQFHVSCFLVYFVTISVFPALTAYVDPTTTSSDSMLTGSLFVPLACFAAFNIADCAGRSIFNLFPMSARRTTLLPCLCVARIVLVPLLLICNVAPLNRYYTPVLLFSNTAYVVLMVILGLSNGYLINAAFVYSPKTVEVEFQEISAGMASWFSAVGSAVGSVLSYGVVSLL